jgi:uncharacterized protein YgiM (DUF1202 family)
MIDHVNNRRLCDFVLWCFAGMVLVIFMTACSPYTAKPANLQITATPSVTATVKTLSNLTEFPPTPRPSCYVTAGTVYLRSGPGMSHAAIDVLRKGEALTVLRRGEWIRVSTGSKAGFIYGRYCQE